MDPHYHIISTPTENNYEGLPATHYTEYASSPNNFQRVTSAGEDTPTIYGQISSHPLTHAHQQQLSQPPTYETVINGHPVSTPVVSYPGYSPSAAHAMEYVQSVYQMQFAAQQIGHGFTDDNHYGGRSMVTSEGKRKRRRIITHEQRKAANIRERRRMFHLNEAFDQLRKRVPTFAYEKKLSRIETLKLAVTYIQFMGELVEEMGGDKKCKSINDSTTSDEGLGTSGDSSSLELDGSPSGSGRQKGNSRSPNILCDIENDENKPISDDDSDFDGSDL